jgi:hypothetical protein
MPDDSRSKHQQPGYGLTAPPQVADGGSTSAKTGSDASTLFTLRAKHTPGSEASGEFAKDRDYLFQFVSKVKRRTVD